MEERQEMYKNTPKEYVQSVKNVIQTGKYGDSLKLLLTRFNDPVFLGSFCLDLYQENKQIIKWLQTPDGQQVDSNKLDQIIIALDYAREQKLI